MSTHLRDVLLKSFGGLAALISLIGLGAALGGCGSTPSGFVPIPPETAGYIGSSACSACHANVYALNSVHPHSQALKPVLDGAPSYPAGPGVPQPPAGFDWSQISYIIDGYVKAANFVDANGFVLTDGTAGTNTQYNLPIPPVDISAGFAPYLPGQTTPLPLDFGLFAHRTTDPQSVDQNGGLRQGNRPGIGGTWAEAGVQCEVCHGPGSQHPSNPSGGTIRVDNSAAACAACHANLANPGVIAAANSLIVGFQQYTELQASPHTGFACTVCHNPHASTTYDFQNAIINDCPACHPTQNMALHEGFVYVRGDYTEPVTCESCHMPYAVETAQFTDTTLTNGRTARFGDTRSHIFRLDPSSTSLADMFTAGGTQITQDPQGQASVSTCYVCQRCHNGLGNAFAFPPQEGCAFGRDIHTTASTQTP